MRFWTREEDEILFDGDYATVEDAVGLLADAGFERSKVAIICRRSIFSLPTLHTYLWSEKELELLLKANKKQLSLKATADSLAKHGFDRSPLRIAEKRSKLGLSTGKSGKNARFAYSEEEERILREGDYETIDEAQQLLSEAGFNRSTHSICIKRHKMGITSQEFRSGAVSRGMKQYWDSLPDDELQKKLRILFEAGLVSSTKGGRGVPNRAEQKVINMAIPGLMPTLMDPSYRVKLRKPSGRPWSKNPDFAYGWQGSKSDGKPKLVIEVTGFGHWRTVDDVKYLVGEYNRVGIRCYAIHSERLKKDPGKFEPRIQERVKWACARIH